MVSSQCNAKVRSECPHHGVTALKHKVELLFAGRNAHVFDGDYINNTYGVHKNKSAYVKQAQELYERLTTEQRSAVLSYVNTLFKTLNLWLSQGDDLSTLPEHHQVTAKNLDTIFDTYGSENVPEVVYRGVREPFALKKVTEMRLGKKVKMLSYVSTTSDPLVVSKFTKDTNPVILKIKNPPKGLPVSFKDNPHNTENEFLLPRDTEYKVTKISRNVSWKFTHEANVGYSLPKVTVIELTAI